MLNFFKNPTYFVLTNNSFAAKAKELLKVYFFMLLAFVLVGVFLKVLDSYVKSTYNFSFLETISFLQTEVLKLNNSKIKNILYIVLLGPMIEEIIFRLPINPEKKYIHLSLTCLCLLFIGGNIFYTPWEVLDIKKKGISILITNCLVYLLVKPVVLNKLKTSFFSNYFYFLAILFGLLHTTNFYEYVPYNLRLLAPLFTLPQTIVGFFAGYIRIKNGFVWGFFLHAMNNIPNTLLHFH